MNRSLFFNKILLLALIVFFFNNAKAQSIDYHFDNNSNNDGFVLQESTRSNLTIRHTINDLSIENVDFKDVSGQILTLNGIFLPNDEGKPNLPYSSRYIAIPKGAKVNVIVKKELTKSLSNINLLPAPKPLLDSDTASPAYRRDPKIYNNNSFFPDNQISISKITQIRDIDVVIIGFTPFKYNPVTKELIVTYDIELEISFIGGNGSFGNPKYRSTAWNHIINDMIINNNVLPDVDYHKLIVDAVNRDASGCEYLIISPDNNDFIQLADSIKLFRNQQGILTKVVTVTECGGNDYNSIRSFILDAYNNWEIPPSAVLLLGDHNSDETQGIVSYSMNNHPGGEGYNPYISDNRYGDMNNDNLPDIVIARITGRNYDELYHLINKDLSYERNPPTNTNFYDKPITAMGYQLERWFQLCSEVVNGFWEHGLGKHPVRQNAIYEGTPGSRWSTNDNTNTVLNYFGPNGLNYIPQTMSHLTEWDANANSVNQAINNGAFIIQHRDHGAEELWGEPSYSISSIKRLVNKDLTFVMSNNCLTGKFNHSGPDGCFAEAFHRHQYGALGLIAATQVSYSFVNDVYVWGVYDNMWPDFMPNFGTQHPSDFILPAYGNASGKFFLQQSSWPTYEDGKTITHYLFHHHGDAYMNLYTEMPQNLNVELLPIVVAGATQYEIKADEGSTICLSVNGEIIGIGKGTGSISTIDIIPQEVGTQICLTITKQNFYRYSRNIATIPTSGPYLIFSDCQLNDNNQNAQLDFNEESELNVALHNVGFEDINNVNVFLSTDSPYIEIINNSANYSNIVVNDIVNLNNAFKIKVSDDIPDQTTINFTLNMNNGVFLFTDHFKLIVNAPVFEIKNFKFSDSNNQILDRFIPNSTTNITFNIKNQGHSNSEEVLFDYNILAPYISIQEPQFSVEKINFSDSIDVTFSVNAAENCPLGAILNDCLKIKSSGYLLNNESTKQLGYTTEDFESENLNTLLQWSNTGSTPWIYDETEPYEGNRCFMSTSNDASHQSKLLMGVTTNIKDKISFYYKLSGENDLFTFMIDSNITDTLTGEGWQYAEYDLPTGTHLIRWYFKNLSGEGNAKIDLIHLPPFNIAVSNAGDDLSVCESSSVSTENAYAYNYKSFEWTSVGDGYFDNPHEISTNYNLGTQDIENENVTLILSVTDENNEILNDSINITINKILTIDTIYGDSYVNISENPISTYHIDIQENANYYWSIEPIEFGELFPDGNKVDVSWAQCCVVGDPVISVYVDNGCISNVFSKTVELTKISVNELSDNVLSIYPNPANNVLSINFASTEISHVKLNIYNLIGDVVMSKYFDNITENQTIILNIENLDSGLFFLELKSPDKELIKKIIIQR